MSVPQPHPKLIPVEDLVKMVISNWSVTYLCSVNLKQCHDKILCVDRFKYFIYNPAFNRDIYFLFPQQTGC